LTAGADADMVVVDPGQDWTVTTDALHDRHRLSPFTGVTFRGRVVRTLLRGQTVFADGALVGAPRGRIVLRAVTT
jgi:allantoinase